MDEVVFQRKSKQKIKLDTLELNIHQRNNKTNTNHHRALSDGEGFNFIIKNKSKTDINTQIQTINANNNIGVNHLNLKPQISYYLPYLNQQIRNTEFFTTYTTNKTSLTTNRNNNKHKAKKIQVLLEKGMSEQCQNKNPLINGYNKRHPKFLQKKAFKALSKDFNKMKPSPRREEQNTWKVILGYNDLTKKPNLSKTNRTNSYNKLGWSYSTNMLPTGGGRGSLSKVNKKKELILCRFPMLKNMGLQGLATERKDDMIKQTKIKNGFNCVEFDI